MKTKIIIWLIVIILLMGLGFWLFYPRTKTNEPLTEDEVTTNVILASEDITVYVKPVKMSNAVGEFLQPNPSSYSIVFKAYLNNTFETPIWFYSDIVHHTSQMGKYPTETFIADKFYFSTDALNYTLLDERYFNFNNEYNLFMPGTNGEVLSLKFNTFNGGLLNLFKTFSYTPAHFAELFNNFIHEDFVKNEEISKETNQYDLLKYFSTYQKNEETSLYEKVVDKKLVFNVNFEKVDSLDEIITTTHNDYVLDEFSKQEMTLTLNKENTTLNFNEVVGADIYVIKDKTGNFVANSNTNSFDLKEVFSLMPLYSNTTKRLYVYAIKEIYSEEQNYYNSKKTTDSNSIDISFHWFSSGNLDFILNEQGVVEYDSINNRLIYIDSGVVGWDLLNKTYEFYINGDLVATTNNSNLSLEDLEFYQDIENGKNVVEIKVFSEDIIFAPNSNDLYFLDENGISVTCEFPILSDRFVGKPTNLTFDENNILSWTGVEWAQNYTVVIHGVTTVVLSPDTLTYDFSEHIQNMSFGNNQISVFAMLDDWQYGVAGYDFVYEHYAFVQYRNGNVETPSNLFFGHPYMSSDWTLTWNGLDPQTADYYEIKIEDYILTSNTKLTGVNRFTINLSNQNLILNGGNHSVCVRAKIGDLYSEWSESISLPVLDTVSQVNYNDETKQLTFLTPETTPSIQFSWTVELINSQGVSIFRPIIQSQGSVPTVNSGETATIDLSGIAPGVYTIKIYVHNWSPLQTSIFTSKNMTPIEITIS